MFTFETSASGTLRSGKRAVIVAARSRCWPVWVRRRPRRAPSREPISPADAGRVDISVGRTASACRRAAARPPRAPSSMRKSAPHATATGRRQDQRTAGGVRSLAPDRGQDGRQYWP